MRIVAGTVPIRCRDGHWEILMIKSMKQSDWIFPKGGVEVGEEIEDAAIRETREEAGVCGTLVDIGIQPVLIVSQKGNQAEGNFFLMRVDKELDEYMETHRQRKWFSAEDVQGQIQREYVRFVLHHVKDWIQNQSSN